MRLVQVAKALGMTGQQLRHELSEVNFGVKPTDREIPDGIAQGIIRFIARKHGITVDMQALGLSVEEEEGGSPAVASEATQEPAKAPEVPAAAAKPSGPVHVLRKLTLEDVPQAAIARQQEALKKKPTKAEREEQLREERVASGQPKVPSATERNQEQIKRKDGMVVLPSHVTVKEFAEKTGVQVPKVIQALMKNGVMVTVNQTIDYDTAAIVAAELGVAVQKEQASVSAEHLQSENLVELLKDEPENLVERAPVVVVMGHVDHGKTSILDAIRETDVVKGESGGITQHIGAYQVVHQSGSETHKITFLDTPGHEAFTAMRARGAQVTDVAVIVVSAEEGVKPTTIEAIHHAQDAGVPMVVALNKIDRPNANPERVKGEMAAAGVQPEEWGGTTPFIACSALTKQGIPDLLDAIILISKMRELKANPNRAAVATVIESQMDTSMGPLGTVIVRTGTLKTGDIFVCSQTTGKIRAMSDAHGARLENVGPSGAVRVAGFDTVPQTGDIVQVVSSEAEARSLVEALQSHHDEHRRRSFADLVSRLSAGKVTHLKIVLKADMQGSLEALQSAIAQLKVGEVQPKVIHAAVGAVSESDVTLAAASDGIVLAFHVSVPPAVMKTAEREGVRVREFRIVYELLSEVEGLLQGLLEPEESEQILGHLEIKGVFMTKRSEQVVGGKVTDGSVKRLPFRIQRAGEEVGTGRITSLRHVDKDIKEAKEGQECGLRTESTIPLLEGDVLEVYIRELKRKEKA
ncbi:translation initiation factor IF-2 [Candidatus Peribacteria bacterium RIFCSPHIGHO2_01_FULL_55_13]|nr:MAG: translation initiation factor IF-2 [Candidatus Peribacteria bacterium RIFCSPHIGHO2_01_FULL_55_13]OGJ65642.1 MAG: translation initiation factor IF-2 [Candidatus Peribacteria bacterium RIFCSPHIGHO2_12_FULL_55_11]